MPKYPQSGDVYESLLYEGQVCEVLTVQHAQVTFRWLGEYERLEPQVVPVNKFIADFSLRRDEKAVSSPRLRSR
jgi:hypothetical protein